MNHKEIEQKEIVEKYILHQLTDDEETAFEEHLLYCKECRKNLAEKENIIYGVQASAKDESDASKLTESKIKNHKSYFSFYRAAAAILIVSSIGLSIFYILKNEGTISSDKNIAVEKKNTSSEKLVEKEQPKLIEQKTIEKEKIVDNKNDDLLAAAYTTSPMFENAIANNYRSESIKVLLPEKSGKFKQVQEIIFEWKSDNHKSLNLAIFNNAEEIIYEKKITSSFKFENSLEKGLYYWQLETEDEAVYVDKFLVN